LLFPLSAICPFLDGHLSAAEGFCSFKSTAVAPEGSLVSTIAVRSNVHWTLSATQPAPVPEIRQISSCFRTKKRSSAFFLTLFSSQPTWWLPSVPFSDKSELGPLSPDLPPDSFLAPVKVPFPRSVRGCQTGYEFNPSKVSSLFLRRTGFPLLLTLRFPSHSVPTTLPFLRSTT